MKVALLQYPIAWADKEQNLQQAEKHIAALTGKADIALLPEMFATGFCCDHPELAEDMNGEIISRLQKLANQTGVAIVSSFICQNAKGQRLVNRGFMITPRSNTPLSEGEKEGIQIQDKRHLYAHGGEDLFFQPAQHRHIFHYNGVKILLLVCYDLRFPVWARNKSGHDYDIILVVANWPEIRIQYWDALIAARATENQCYIAAVNCVGNDGMNLHYNGHSIAYDTRLQPLVSFQDNEEGTKIAHFDIPALHHFREVLPLWKDIDSFDFH